MEHLFQNIKANRPVDFEIKCCNKQNFSFEKNSFEIKNQQNSQSKQHFLTKPQPTGAKT